jgi:hypothetical protein
MHYGLVLLLLALGTCVYFPRLAKLLVGLGLVGVLAFVLVAVGQGIKQDKDRARLEQETAARSAQVQAQAADAACVAWIADTDVCLRTAGERRLGTWRPVRPQLEAFREAHPDWEAFKAIRARAEAQAAEDPCAQVWRYRPNGRLFLTQAAGCPALGSAVPASR